MGVAGSVGDGGKQGVLVMEVAGSVGDGVAGSVGDGGSRECW